MKLKKVLQLVAVCTVFLLSIVLLAIVALFFLTSSVFTNDIRFVLIGSIVALILFSVYLFSIKLSSLSKTVNDRVNAYRSKREKRRYHVPPPNQTEQPNGVTAQIEKPKPMQPAKPPVFEKKEEKVEKKVYTPVFGSSSTSNNNKHIPH